MSKLNDFLLAEEKSVIQLINNSSIPTDFLLGLGEVHMSLKQFLLIGHNPYELLINFRSIV